MRAGMDRMVDHHEASQQAKIHLSVALDLLDEMLAFEAAAYVASALDIIVCLDQSSSKIPNETITDFSIEPQIFPT